MLILKRIKFAKEEKGYVESENQKQLFADVFE